jgi:hypothetical protein
MMNQDDVLVKKTRIVDIMMDLRKNTFQLELYFKGDDNERKICELAKEMNSICQSYLDAYHHSLETSLLELDEKILIHHQKQDCEKTHNGESA